MMRSSLWRSFLMKGKVISIRHFNYAIIQAFFNRFRKKGNTGEKEINIFWNWIFINGSFIGRDV